MLVPLYIAAIGLVMLASAVWRYRQRDMVGIAASPLLAALCAYALMLSPARSDPPALTPIARCEFLLRMLMQIGRAGMTYRHLDATEQADPLTVMIEFETRNRARVPGRSIGSCEFDRDRRHISFITQDGFRSQIIYD
ncbi:MULTISPECIES: hypothetical protein [unclassified Mesorhizobium]|uniref:hypothetical protein n=1 Tax=unclassified Mesorhizobium TaxID=325217 RepID=UPI000FCC0519|nr:MULTISPECIES: hypothetical protein [unclassified Mesorhizobium]TIT79865.1 MAG: hypothetical protein E5W57_05280 [Mesorhizobium sp.]TGP26409.1 hypothetical protein EN874_001660 [Mesorhizobium sp. M1D.F.Ca.ET.231.01.1.1]TGP38367.1 hypothetical protein EN877_01660 [Mesorhizobium sp. M1D.F.Ca.ET.234.01.1.1]TGS50577.1 hypothetical protein EN827_01660 [Mesorhizobium sp. M1D.F.Ca.ET.184.01.1.1]TGS66462.1 hypothetical protein EN826_001660 [Mesorhizobium sp. M1D.F.Ca.ET.183.01.1.1]